jgi:Leucine-rich repeat (LRR) protein
MPNTPPAGKREYDYIAMSKAMERIEQARCNGDTVLDLSGLGLTTLPETLGKLTALQRLYLSKNQLTSVPEVLGKLTKLRVLDLVNNHLTNLP